MMLMPQFAVHFSSNKRIASCNTPVPSPKRPVDTDDLLLPLSRITKRRTKSQNLYVDEYDALCATLTDLTYTAMEEPCLSEFDNMMALLTDLGVEQQISENWNVPMPDLLSMQWYSHIPPLIAARSNIRRAIRQCKTCGLDTYRDILWYNDTLSRAVSLQRFPNCLVDIAYHLSDWDPRKRRPQTSPQEWTSAWQALTIAWSDIIVAWPSELRQELLNKRFTRPPPTANWFEFNYFDGIYDEVAPLLCYHEDPVEHVEDSNLTECEKYAPAEQEEDLALNSPSNNQPGELQNAVQSYLRTYDNGYLSDQDPRRHNGSFSDNLNSDSETD